MKKLITIAALVLNGLACLGQAPPPTLPAWLTTEQQTVVPGQLKIFYDACTGEYHTVPFRKNGKNPLRQLRIPARRTVMLEIVRLNPAYFDRIEFSGTATTRFTAERNVVRTGDSPEPGEEQRVGPSGSPPPTRNRNPVADLEKRFKELQDQYARSSSRFDELEKLLVELEEFRRTLKTQLCFDFVELKKQRIALEYRLIKAFGVSALSDPEAMTEAVTNEIAAFRSAIGIADEARKTLEDERASVSGGRPNDEIRRLAELEVNLKAFGRTLANDRRRLERQTGEVARARIERLARDFIASQNLTVTTFRLHPFQAPEDADEIRITATGIKATSDPANPSRERLLDLTLPVIWGFKVDFSPGAAYTALHDDVFTVLEASKPKTVLNKEGKDEIVPGEFVPTYTILRHPNRGSVLLNTNAHAIWRLTPGLSGGFHLGLGVDFLNEQRVRYLAGGTVKFGGTLDNLMLNFGVAMGNVTRLSPDQQVDLAYDIATTAKTYDQFDAGFYLGLNYVLGRNKTKKAAEPNN